MLEISFCGMELAHRFRLGLRIEIICTVSFNYACFSGDISFLNLNVQGSSIFQDDIDIPVLCKSLSLLANCGLSFLGNGFCFYNFHIFKRTVTLILSTYMPTPRVVLKLVHGCQANVEDSMTINRTSTGKGKLMF